MRDDSAAERDFDFVLNILNRDAVPRGGLAFDVDLQIALAARIDKLLVHELTHVVLADYFAQYQTSRWADEGIAVLSEPAERRTKLREWLTQEAKQGRLFSLQELTKQRSVPQDKRLGELFYAQSAHSSSSYSPNENFPKPNCSTSSPTAQLMAFPMQPAATSLTRLRIAGKASPR